MYGKKKPAKVKPRQKPKQKPKKKIAKNDTVYVDDGDAADDESRSKDHDPL